MIGSIASLLLCQLAGEIAARALGLPLPGPVLGMALMFAILLARGGVPEPLQDTAGGLLSHLSLLFVPAGVGVMTQVSVIAGAWDAVAAALIGSTVLTIAVTALVMRALAGPAEREDEGGRP